MTELEIDAAYAAVIRALQDGNTHDAAEVMFRVGARMWLKQATAFGPDVADEFLTAVALDLQDHAKADGRALFNKMVVN